MPVPGPLELALILVIVAMLFGVGKLPEVFGAVGKGIREFRKESTLEGSDGSDTSDAATETVAAATDSVTTNATNTVATASNNGAGTSAAKDSSEGGQQQSAA
jgi:sec-independent protein translocase protein TatA